MVRSDERYHHNTRLSKVFVNCPFPLLQVDGAQSTPNCDNASSYCGVRDSKYPDKRAMGFPFDRVPRSGVLSLEQFLTPNMAVLDVKIKFTDRVVARRPLNPTKTGRPQGNQNQGRPQQQKQGNNWG